MNQKILKKVMSELGRRSAAKRKKEGFDYSALVARRWRKERAAKMAQE